MTAVLRRNNYHFIHKKPQIHMSGHGFSVKDGPTNQHRGHRHPELSDFTARLSTFRNWTYESVQSSNVLARNGFFYTGEVDKVRCFSCSIGFKDFHSTDDIFIEHLRHSPSCRYLTKLLDERSSGENIVEKGKETEIRKHDIPPVSWHHGTNQQPVPVSPEFESYTARLASYRGWPAGKAQTPEQLAAAGFYFTGCDDIVRCHSCDGGLNNWDPLDDPWIEHARHFQRCSFLRKVKGEEYIRLVHNHYQTLLKPKHLPQSRVSDVGYKCTRVQVKGSHLSPKSHHIKEQLLEMGFTNEDIDKALLICIREKADTTLDNALDEIDKLKKLDETQVIVTKDEQVHRVNMQDQIDEYRRLKYELNCKICQQVPSNTLFLPCQHHCSCSACSDLTSKCPLCGENIQHKIRTFL